MFGILDTVVKNGGLQRSEVRNTPGNAGEDLSDVNKMVDVGRRVTILPPLARVLFGGKS